MVMVHQLKTLIESKVEHGQLYIDILKNHEQTNTKNMFWEVACATVCLRLREFKTHMYKIVRI